MTSLPPPGSFGLSRIGGRTGVLVTVGQAIIGDASRYTHAFVVVDAENVVQAMPRGAELAPLIDYLGRDDVVFCDAPVHQALDRYRRDVTPLLDPDGVGLDLWLAAYEEGLRQLLATFAMALLGRPYSFADYLALALAHLGVRAPWLRRYIDSSGHMICSQLVDSVYRRAGIHLFDDGRLPQDVTPGDLDLYRVRQLELQATTR